MNTFSTTLNGARNPFTFYAALDVHLEFFKHSGLSKDKPDHI